MASHFFSSLASQYRAFLWTSTKQCRQLTRVIKSPLNFLMNRSHNNYYGVWNEILWKFLRLNCHGAGQFHYQNFYHWISLGFFLEWSFFWGYWTFFDYILNFEEWIYYFIKIWSLDMQIQQNREVSCTLLSWEQGGGCG